MYANKNTNSLKPFIILLSSILIVLSVLPIYLGINTLSGKVFGDFSLVIINLLALGILIYTTWWSFKNNKGTYRPWLMFVVGQSFYALAELLYLASDFSTNSYSLIADPTFMITYPFFIIGILLFIKKPFKLQTKVFLDLIITIASTFFILWFLLIEPRIQLKGLLSTFSGLLYIFLDISLLFVVLTLLVSKNKKISELTVLFLLATVFSQILGDLVFAYNNLDPNLFYQWLSTIMYMLSPSFTALAAVSFVKNINLNLSLTSFSKILKPERSWQSYIPLVLVLFTYSLLFISQTINKVLIECVGVIITLIVIRELISLDELKKTHKDLKKNKELIEKSEQQLNFISSNMMDLITEANEEFVYKYVNNSSHSFLGYKPEEIIGNNLYDFVYPEDVEIVQRSVETAIKNHSSERVQYRCKKSAGDHVWVETIRKPIFNNENRFKGFICSTRDISVQKENEIIVHDSLKEKEMLLREIHHRVKNNLQIVSSLLNLQSYHVDEEEALDILTESKNRIKTMALVHEELYRSPNLTNISFNEYLERLVSNLFYSYGVNKQNITPKFHMEEIKIGIDTAIPCGLIVNELVTNSLKYAFTNDMGGNIEVTLKADGDMYAMKVADNGVGLPADIEPENVETLGLQLVANLVKQLDGNFEINRANGTEFKITFPEQEYTKRV